MGDLAYIAGAHAIIGADVEAERTRARYDDRRATLDDAARWARSISDDLSLPTAIRILASNCENVIRAAVREREYPEAESRTPSRRRAAQRLLVADGRVGKTP